MDRIQSRSSFGMALLPCQSFQKISFKLNNGCINWFLLTPSWHGMGEVVL